MCICCRDCDACDIGCGVCTGNMIPRAVDGAVRGMMQGMGRGSKRSCESPGRGGGRERIRWKTPKQFKTARLLSSQTSSALAYNGFVTHPETDWQPSWYYVGTTVDPAQREIDHNDITSDRRPDIVKARLGGTIAFDVQLLRHHMYKAPATLTTSPTLSYRRTTRTLTSRRRLRGRLESLASVVLASTTSEDDFLARRVRFAGPPPGPVSGASAPIQASLSTYTSELRCWTRFCVVTGEVLIMVEVRDNLAAGEE